MKLETPKCPACQQLAECTLERFVHDGSADLLVSPTGAASWGGDTEVPWESQRTIVNRRGEVAVGCHAGHWWWTTITGFDGSTHADDDAIDDPRDRLVRGAYKHFQTRVGRSSVKKLAHDAGLRWSARRRAWYGRPSHLRKLRAALAGVSETAAVHAIREALERALQG